MDWFSRKSLKALIDSMNHKLSLICDSIMNTFKEIYSNLETLNSAMEPNSLSYDPELESLVLPKRTTEITYLTHYDAENDTLDFLTKDEFFPNDKDEETDN